MSITLTAGQQAAHAALVNLMTTDQNVLVISGFAGTGKTTLLKNFFDDWQQLVSISGGRFADFDLVLTATTNKAADAVANATGQDPITTHSFLGLRVVNTGYKQTRLVHSGKPVDDGVVLVIDEASFIDGDFLQAIQRLTKHIKVVYMGDANQLAPVGASNTPVFDAGYPTVHLTEIVRQADTSPIQALSKGLRDHVDGLPMPKAGVDGVNILHMPQEEFEANLVKDCIQFPANTVRALSWTNAKAIYYNNLVAQAARGSSDLHVGDTVLVNKMIQRRDVYKFPTDSSIFISAIGNWYTDSNGIFCRKITTHTGVDIKQAQNAQDVDDLLKKLYDDKRISDAERVQNTYADLRLAFSSTVNKSQGSTFDTVYIDLRDIGKCREPDQVKRMLYVAVSRARSKVVFTGDI